MRVGIFTDSYYPHVSGVATSIEMLKEALLDMGHKVYIVAPNLDNNKFIYDKEKEIIWLPGIKTGIYKTKLTPIYSKKAMKIIKNEWNLDIIHSQTEFGVGYFSRIIAKKLHIPVVHTYHTLYEDYVYYVTHGHFDKWAKRMAIKITKYYCDTHCDELIVPTKKIKDLFINKYNITRNMAVIPTGIDIKKFYATPSLKKQAKELRAKYNIEPDDFLIGSVGRVATEKSFDKLIINLKVLVKDNPKIKAMIVGAGPALEDLQELTKSLDLTDNVIFTGLVDYNLIPSYYQIFNVMTSFSTTETQGLTIIEGLAAEKPTVCINDDSFKEMIQDKYNGYLFKNDQDFQNIIIRLLSDKKLYNEMSQNAKNSTHPYSKEVFASEVLKVYYKALKKYSGE